MQENKNELIAFLNWWNSLKEYILYITISFEQFEPINISAFIRLSYLIVFWYKILCTYGWNFNFIYIYIYIYIVKLNNHTRDYLLNHSTNSIAAFLSKEKKDKVIQKPNRKWKGARSSQSIIRRGCRQCILGY